MTVSKRDDQSARRRRPPATTPEARENQLIALAVDLAEKQLSEGTASSQVISHYLKLGSTRERLEKEKLQKENELLTAKTEAIKSSKDNEKLYNNAIKAMQRYSGRDEVDDDD
jgi:hypothetical protein